MDILASHDTEDASDASYDQDKLKEANDRKACQARWLREIDRALKAYEPYEKRCDKIAKLYNYESGLAEERSSARRYAMLWANTQTLMPAVYSRQPEPTVTRRFKDADPVARTASEMLERGVLYTFDECAFDGIARQVRDDFLLFARSTAWPRYEAEIDTDEATGEETIRSERVVWEHVPRRDLIHPPALSWAKLPWVGRRAYLTRDELIKRFGDKLGRKIPLDHKPPGSGGEDGDQEAEAGCKAAIYEIWSKVDREVFWISRAHDECLDRSEPLLDLKDFFPCPKPAYGTLKPDTLTPVPDYVYYQDQAEEINEVTQRIGALTDSLKLVGFYPATGAETVEPIELALSAGTENVLIPVPSWAVWSEKGGSQQIQWLPIDQVAKVLEANIQLRKELIADVYQITGISDIVRGQSDPDETAKAQGLKAQWGSLRIRDRQIVLAQWIRDAARITAEIISDRFQPETLLMMSNMKLPTQADLDQQALEAQRQALMQQAQAAPMPGIPSSLARQGMTPPAGGPPNAPQGMPV
jgi:hypothetical protein